MLHGGSSPGSPEQAPLTGGYGKGYGNMAAPYIYPWSFMWFGAALCVMIGAVMSFINEVFSLEWVDALEMAYLFMFGVLLATVDTPLFTSVMLVTNIRQSVNRFVAVLTRVTGKGVVYMFLGCTLWSSMWTNLEDGVLLFLACFLGIIIFATGLISVFLGIMKSRNLNLVRNELRKDQGMANLEQMYVSHARINPAMGLTPDEFNKMSPYARGVQFEASDLRFIFNALSSEPQRMFISREDLANWVQGSMVFI